jgi:DNA-binding winged helix-turn-helix (wHTH) protein
MMHVQDTRGARPADQSGAVATSGMPRSGGHNALVLDTTDIGRDFRLSHMASRTHEWFAVHRRDCAPELVTDHPPDVSRATTLPIVVVASRGEERGRLLSELTAHVGAALRGHQALDRHVIDVEELHIDREAHCASVGGVHVRLSSLQFKLLFVLVERRDRVQSRGALLRDIWGIDPRTATRTVDTQVKRLRDHLGAAGRFIHTIRGVGYRFSAARPTARPHEWRALGLAAPLAPPPGEVTSTG